MLSKAFFFLLDKAFILFRKYNFPKYRKNTKGIKQGFQAFTYVYAHANANNIFRAFLK